MELFAEPGAATPGEPCEPVWSWDARTAEGLADERRGWFEEIDEVKPARLEPGREVILITASYRGAAAVIERSSKRLLFSGSCRNAHSAEILPGGLLAVACSLDTNELQLWRVSDGALAEEPAGRTSLIHGHAAVWQPDARRLWTVGTDKAVTFAVGPGGEGPRITLEREIELPEGGSHEMLPDPHTGGLVVSTGRRCWRLDPETFEITPFEPLARVANVKSVSIERDSRVIAFQKGECGGWSSENVYLLGPGARLRTLVLPGRRLYKARWDQPCQLGAQGA